MTYPVIDALAWERTREQVGVRIRPCPFCAGTHHHGMPPDAQIGDTVLRAGCRAGSYLVRLAGDAARVRKRRGL